MSQKKFRRLIILSSLSATLLLAQNSTRIVNGSEVTDSSSRWNFIVSLESEGEPICGGTLISPDWVVTAAHCVAGEDGQLMEGSLDMSITSGNYSLKSPNIQRYSIEKIIPNPNYSPSTNDNDIALIKLSTYNTTVEYFPNIKESISLYKGRVSFVAGWGNLVGDETLEPSYPDRLNELKVPIVDYDTCNSGYEGDLTNNMFCAGYLEGGKDSCQGDSGGPLITYDNGEANLIGIVSWGEGCALPDKAGIYSKVQNYYSWIISNTGELSTKNTKYIATKTDSLADITKLYVATFNRAPDSTGISYWLNSTLSIEGIASSFFDQAETKALYPDSKTTEEFIVLVYQNLFNRTPDDEGLAYWSEELSNGSISKSYFILAVINGARGDDDTILNNKQRVGEHFANSSLDNIESAYSVMSGVDSSSDSVDSAFAQIDTLSR